MLNSSKLVFKVIMSNSFISFVIDIGSAQLLSCVPLFVTPLTIAHNAPLSMEFSRQEYWSRLQSPTLRNLPDPGIEPVSLEFPALAGRLPTSSTTWKPQF